MDEQYKKEFVEKIREVFSKVKKPADTKVRRDIDELKEIAGKTWEDLSLEDINKNTFLGFFTREGLRYYVAAYLIAAIIYPDKMQNSMGIIRALTPETNTSWDENPTVGADFSPEEKSVIRQFFEIYSEIYPIPNELSTHRIYLEDKQTLERGVRYWRHNQG